MIDLRRDPRFVDQYVELRNSHAEVLMTEPVSPDDTREWLRTADVEVRGIVRGDDLEGVVILYPGRQGEVALFARTPGAGTGSALLQLVEAAARERRLAALWSWVRKENTIAQRSFEKNGYRPAGEETRTYRGERRQGILFRKRLA